MRVERPLHEAPVLLEQAERPSFVEGGHRGVATRSVNIIAPNRRSPFCSAAISIRLGLFHAITLNEEEMAQVLRDIAFKSYREVSSGFIAPPPAVHAP